MPAWVSLYAPIVARLAGSDVPLAMLLGHIQVESGGKPNDRTSLDERGLMQIHPGTSKQMGFDHSRMFEPAYSIWAGVEMFKRMADRLQQEYRQLFPARDEFFWRMVRFEFAIGSGAARQILSAMRERGVQSRSWPAFVSFLRQYRDELLHLTRHDPVKWAASVDKVFAAGNRLIHGVIVVGSGGAVLVLAAAALALYLYNRSRTQTGGL